jgi:hypothetical protein
MRRHVDTTVAWQFPEHLSSVRSQLFPIEGVWFMPR